MPSTPSGRSSAGSNSPAPAAAAASGKGILTASVASANATEPAANATSNGSAAAAGTTAKPAAPISAGNTVSLHQLITGCKVFVERPDDEPRKAEILSIRQTRPPRPPRNKDGTLAVPKEDMPKPTTEYYVHYVEFNKRLDEWVGSMRLLMSMPVEWPVPKDAAAGAHGSHGAHGGSSNRSRPSKAGDQGLRKTAIKQAASKAGQTQKSLAGSNDRRDKKKKKLTGAAAAAQAMKAASAAAAKAPGTPAADSATPAPSTAPGSVAGDDEDSGLMNIDSPSTRSVSVNPDRESSADIGTPRDGSPADDMDEDDKDAEADSDREEAEGDESQAGAVIVAEVMDEDDNPEDDADPSEAVPPNNLAEHATYSKEEEIESLRTHGSMTQSVHEVARVKNLDKIQIGAHEVEAWYFSPYPVEYAHIPVLYICEFCLTFLGSPKMLERHRRKCTLLHPPGNEVYRHEEISFYEIDGKKQKTWCRNLCLLSKAFLDHKTLYYDVDPFLFYVMCKRDDVGVHMIGYFSKEKESAENYNVACILTLPQYQRFGYGRLLIEFSYELSKKEGKLGSPEKPLSDLGLLSYRKYWQEVIVDFIMRAKMEGKTQITIDEIAQRTSIVHGDIMHTAQTLQMLKVFNGQHVLCLSDTLIEQHERIKQKKRRRINPAALRWKPPVFSKEQLRFGY